MDIQAEINNLKGKIAALEEDVKTATGEEKIVLKQEIISLNYQLTELYKLLALPTPAPGNILSISIE